MTQVNDPNQHAIFSLVRAGFYYSFVIVVLAIETSYTYVVLWSYVVQNENAICPMSVFKRHQNSCSAIAYQDVRMRTVPYEGKKRSSYFHSKCSIELLFLLGARESQ